MDILKDRAILIVDDEREILASLSHFLQAAGMRVFVASCAQTALALSRVFSFDVILTDARMPHLNGFGLAMLLRNMNVSAPIIMMTGLLDLDMEGKLPKLGIARLIEKPFERKHLLSTLTAALAEGGRIKDQCNSRDQAAWD